MKMQFLSLMLLVSVVSAANAGTVVSKAAVVVPAPSRLESLVTTVKSHLTVDAVKSDLSSAWTFVSVTHRNKAIAAATLVALYGAYKYCPVAKRMVKRMQDSCPSCPFTKTADKKNDTSAE